MFGSVLVRHSAPRFHVSFPHVPVGYFGPFLLRAPLRSHAHALRHSRLHRGCIPPLLLRLSSTRHGISLREKHRMSENRRTSPHALPHGCMSVGNAACSHLVVPRGPETLRAAEGPMQRSVLFACSVHPPIMVCVRALL
eukprot:3572105-Prymnesium_polylepis.1